MHGSKEIHRSLWDNRVWMEKRFDEWTSLQDMEKDVKHYLDVVSKDLYLVRCKKYLEDELQMLKRVLDKIKDEDTKGEIDFTEVHISYLQIAKEIFMIHGLDDMLNSDPNILTEDWMLKELKMQTKQEKCLKFVEDTLTTLKNDLRRLRKENKLSDEGMDANQLKDLIEMEELDEQENKKAMKERIMSLNEQLASFKFAMDQIAARRMTVGDGFWFDIRDSINYCESRLRYNVYKDCKDEEDDVETKPEVL